MKFCLTLVFLLILSSQVQAELFKWKDAEGNIIYSDQPPPGAAKQETQIEEESLPEIISVPAVEPTISSSSRPTKKISPEKYTSLAITQPPHDTAIRENSGKVTISVRVEPSDFAERGHNLIIYMDGEEISRGQQTSVTLDNVDRGTHTLSAQIVNSQGQSVKKSETTTFHLQRYSI